MDTEVNFFPRTFNISKIQLKSTDKFFVLIGTDKALRRQHVIKILKKRDN